MEQRPPLLTKEKIRYFLLLNLGLLLSLIHI